MDRDAWRPWLERWSEEWIDAHDPERDRPHDDDVLRHRWLGFAPAAPERIAAAEARLGRALPPSFREFLLVTDGWRYAGSFIWRLGGAGEIGWMRDLDAHWIEAYAPNIPARALQISLEGDAAVLFLDPGDVDPDGEWAAYFQASWTGDGPRRHPSFHALMRHLYAGFHALRRPPGPTRDFWTEATERARLAALAGEVDGPLEVLEEACRFGIERARLLRFQMLTLLGNHEMQVQHLLLDEDAWLAGDPILEAELLPLLYSEHRRRHQWGGSVLELLKEHGPERLRPLVARYEARAREPGHRPRFGPPEFDERVRAVQAGLSLSGMDAAWPALRDAMAFWRPVSEHHIAPVVLFSDPLLATLITPERGREILAVRRWGGPG
ncbi:SMI1/KNR4 family protein [Actinomadura rugatobispora]|uniref:SMI1/KNR4 family protein n=1 Tax=Actinomadura rugatobispora TaxID=1994 RepID=A0ABW1AAY1_9ACTN